MSQISIIKKSDIQEARRFDAEYFKLDVMNLLKNDNLHFLNLGDEIVSFKTGDNLEQTNLEDENSSVYFLRTQQIRQIYINDNNLTKIKNPNKYLKIKTGDLLFTRVGEGVGNSSVVMEEYENNTISDNVISVKLKTLNPFFVSVFLNTKYGQLFLNRTKKGTARGLISKDNFFGIYIPKFENLYNLCEENIKKYYQKQTRSKQLYKEVEEALLKELDLLDYKPEQILSFQTTKKETDEAKRFDAEYFQPKYDEIIKKIEKYKNGWDFVKNIVHHKKGVEVGSETYQQEGMSFGRVSDFSINGVEKTGKKISQGLYQELKKDYQPKRNDILFTKDGTIGLSYVFKKEFEVILSGAFLRLSLKDKYQLFEKECLSLIFNSIISKMQVEKLSGGAIIAHLKPSDFEKFKIPLIKSQIQKQIAEKIKESHKLRKESKELLEEAKRRVEAEIEKEL